MPFHDITEVVEKKLGVPVINPVKASILMAESLVKMKLVHSKLAYPIPSKNNLLVIILLNNTYSCIIFFMSIVYLVPGNRQEVLTDLKN